MRWVKLTLPAPVRASWLFRIWRLTSSSFAGTARTEVAVGTPRLASMFSTVRAARAAQRLGLVAVEHHRARAAGRGRRSHGAGGVARAPPQERRSRCGRSRRRASRPRRGHRGAARRRRRNRRASARRPTPGSRGSAGTAPRPARSSDPSSSKRVTRPCVAAWGARSDSCVSESSDYRRSSSAAWNARSSDCRALSRGSHSLS